ncbi:arp2/3 complex 16 kd subunit p16-arc [Anaeramoeba flamelloides]|uniref:Actin-related protein 2/3 complex subunit 5 n=1 Tax=Anaeramoeba flamelloides TaxID=1746091 RepID=A0AAV7YCA2_9EUKA|nr:arp2/3 complex 16 kd subunit p16-arc [Anaeramoeba flamelloides]KAJ6228227.1 arp2/3 complex 16 kd subunit p16-arc [Anaeramoeba flamelloides]
MSLTQFLENPPYEAQPQEKQNIYEQVINILGDTADNKMKDTCNNLDTDQQDALMRYIYKGLENNDNSLKLLKWHGVLSEVAGLGCIMRVMSEKRKRVL